MSTSSPQRPRARPRARSRPPFLLHPLGLRRRLRQIPRAAGTCALVGILNAVCWSLITPPFQAPDEPDHFAYVKQLAETGELPSSSSEQLSGEEIQTLVAIHALQVRQQPQVHTIATKAEQEALERTLAQIPRETGSVAAGVATSQPPLYYAIETIPYDMASAGSVLDRLQLMRLVSALFAGMTAMFAYLFVREALPATAWAWTVAGLSVALVPLLGFTSGAVTPDSLLFAVCAATFYCLARAFRRGLSIAGALAIGALTAVGLSTKVNFAGLLPGVIVGLAVLARRAAPASRAQALHLLGPAIAIALSPVAVYATVHALSHHPLLGVASTAIADTHGSLAAQLDYVWQLYLPRLPGTSDDFSGLFTTRQLWFDGYVGLYGWLDTPFPAWVDSVALIPAGAIALLCTNGLLHGRRALGQRRGEIAVYAIIAVGLLVLIGADSYRSFPATDAEYAQVRYLLPLLAPFGAALGLAARGAGRRFGPAAGTLIVVLFLAHDLFSQLQVLARYYG